MALQQYMFGEQIYKSNAKSLLAEFKHNMANLALCQQLNYLNCL